MMNHILNIRWQQYMYGMFCLIGMALMIEGSPSLAAIYMGIALAFDPFNPDVSFERRPLWQRIWLMAHLVVMLVLMAGTWLIW